MYTQTRTLCPFAQRKITRKKDTFEDIFLVLSCRIVGYHTRRNTKNNSPSRAKSQLIIAASTIMNTRYET